MIQSTETNDSYKAGDTVEPKQTKGLCRRKVSKGHVLRIINTKHPDCYLTREREIGHFDGFTVPMTILKLH